MHLPGANRHRQRLQDVLGESSSWTKTAIPRSATFHVRSCERAWAGMRFLLYRSETVANFCDETVFERQPPVLSSEVVACSADSHRAPSRWICRRHGRMAAQPPLAPVAINGSAFILRARRSDGAGSSRLDCGNALREIVGEYPAPVVSSVDPQTRPP